MRNNHNGNEIKEKDNIKVGHKEVDFMGMCWIQLAYDKVHSESSGNRTYVHDPLLIMDHRRICGPS